MPDRTCIMISSTLLDLPEHRKDVFEACLRQGMEPMCMERLPDSDATFENSVTGRWRMWPRDLAKVLNLRKG